MFRPLFAWSLLVDPAFCRCSRWQLEMPLQMCANRTTSVLHKSCTLQIWTSYWYQKILFYHFYDEKTHRFCIDLGIYQPGQPVTQKNKRCLVNGGKSQFGLSNFRFGLELTKQFQFECKQKTPEKSTEHSKSIQKLNSNINYHKFISTDSSVTLIIPALFWQNTKWKTRYFASGFAACGP